MQLLEGNTDNYVNFSGKDNYDRYLSNLKEQPANWPWRNSQITYTLNSQKYRAPEWKDCNWSNSILVFGCSMVYGVGVDDKDTVTTQLSNFTNTPTINLGMGGTGLMFQLANSIILRENNVTPRAVVYIWPDKSRQTEFFGDKQVSHHGSWNVEHSCFKEAMLNDLHSQHMADYLIRNIRLLWNCPIIEASWYTNMASLTGGISLCFKDFARDCAHPGPETLKEAAEIIANRLTK